MTLRAEPIATRRLLLEPLRTGHAEPMAAVLADPALYDRIGGAPPTPADLRRRYTAMLAGPPGPDEAWLNWIITAPEPAGWVQATVRTAPEEAAPAPDRPSAALAWVVGTPWQGRGLASEAARATCAWLARNGVRCLTAAIAPGHTASERVARSCGMAPTAEHQQGERIWRLTAPGPHPPR
ncbi:GNAT family N-acetyltransferase [Nocardiopsis sp. RSe5-2]|uniref:GNAT family N-acetyltransferase n=1 Tax=Nocardiopsis endophytica TaxID=3018445 RepID=A0ABT4UBN6_9ACTN|nr:GNAT family N-acetyltransferase [Nocardiopsis endophytica]MDA2814297.1 GNAT family N-acetyltransferase [Nocardiopsis endophytica]